MMEAKGREISALAAAKLESAATVLGLRLVLTLIISSAPAVNCDRRSEEFDCDIDHRHFFRCTFQPCSKCTADF